MVSSHDLVPHLLRFLGFGEEGVNESVTVAESTHHAHVKNFDLVVPQLPHPLLLARSDAAQLHCLLTWRNSSVEQRTTQCYSVAEVRGVSGLTGPTKKPNFTM